MRAAMTLAVIAAASSACSNTSNNASVGAGGAGTPAVAGSGGVGTADSGALGADAVADSDAAPVIPNPNAPYLWFAGAELQAFTKEQTAASTDAGPSVTVAPNAMTATFHDLVFDPDGALWTIPIVGDRILKISAIDLMAGARPVPELAISSPALASPQSLAFDALGNLWVVNFNGTSAGIASIVRFDHARMLTGDDGMLLIPSLTIGPGTDPTLRERFKQGTAIGFDATGNLWFGASKGLMRFETPAALQGTVVAAPSAFLSTGESCLSFAFDAADALWVSSAASGFHVRRFGHPASLTGDITPMPDAKLTIPAQDATFAGGLGFDADGSLWIAMSNRLIRVASPGALSGNVTAMPDVVLGLSPAIFPDLTTKVAFWPTPPGLPIH